jgi:IMP dehydrogenase
MSKNPTFVPPEEKIEIKQSYTFDDVLLLPGYTDFTRDEVDLGQQITKNIYLKLPILSSPMDTVTMSETAIVMAKAGGLGIIHRNLEISEQVEEIKKVKNQKLSKEELNKAAVEENNRLLVGAAIGPSVDLEERLKALVKAGLDIVLIDSAHGHKKEIIDLIKSIKQKYPTLPIIAGNIATRQAARDLIQAGADVLRVGMGPGSICTTRIVTGMGVPQLTAVAEVASVAKENGVKVIADGGIKQIGDIPKAIGFGADLVMLGSMLAGFNQSPGEIIKIENQKYKSYRGMGSINAMKKGAASRYGQSFDAKKLIAEGVEGLVRLKGDLADFLYQIEGGLRSSFYDCGFKNITEFYEKSRFVKISINGLKESHPHTIDSITEKGGTYL